MDNQNYPHPKRIARCMLVSRTLRFMLPDDMADRALRILAPRPLPLAPSLALPDSHPFMGVPFLTFRFSGSSCCCCCCGTGLRAARPLALEPELAGSSLPRPACMEAAPMLRLSWRGLCSLQHGLLARLCTNVTRSRCSPSI